MQVTNSSSKLLKYFSEMANLFELVQFKKR